MDKKEFISKIANTLVETETTMYVKDLSQILNWNKFKTDNNEEYAGKRGTYKLIHSVYDWLKQNKRDIDADNVAKVYMKSDRTYAYEK